MSLFPLIILAFVQGLTEFLPVSSSGHLVLVHAYFGGGEAWASRVTLDVAVHVGTLLSVLVYYRDDVWAMICGFLGCFTGDFKSAGGRLAFHVIVASIPVILAGFALHIWAPSWLALLEVMAWSTIVFALVLWVSDRCAQRYESLEQMGMVHALLIGLAQALALIPGTSRSGVTMSAARFLGYSRTEAAHFSLMLAIVAIAGAGTLVGLDLYESGDARLGMDALIVCAVSFVFGWLSIAAMMRWLERSSFTVFVVYRLILGAVLLTGLYAGWFGS